MVAVEHEHGCLREVDHVLQHLNRQRQAGRAQLEVLGHAALKELPVEEDEGHLGREYEPDSPEVLVDHVELVLLAPPQEHQVHRRHRQVEYRVNSSEHRSEVEQGQHEVYLYQVQQNDHDDEEIVEGLDPSSGG